MSILLNKVNFSFISSKFDPTHDKLHANVQLVQPSTQQYRLPFHHLEQFNHKFNFLHPLAQLCPWINLVKHYWANGFGKTLGTWNINNALRCNRDLQCFVQVIILDWFWIHSTYHMGFSFSLCLLWCHLPLPSMLDYSLLSLPWVRVVILKNSS